MPNDANNNKDIVLHYRDDGLKHVSELHIGAMTHCNIPDCWHASLKLQN